MKLTELRIPIEKSQYFEISRNRLSVISVPPEILRTIESPYDFDRIRLTYRSRELFRYFEGLDKDGSLHIGDRHNRHRCLASE